jgi:hypothetical protein
LYLYILVFVITWSSLAQESWNLLQINYRLLGVLPKKVHFCFNFCDWTHCTYRRVHFPQLHSYRKHKQIKPFKINHNYWQWTVPSTLNVIIIFCTSTVCFLYNWPEHHVCHKVAQWMWSKKDCININFRTKWDKHH